MNENRVEHTFTLPEGVAKITDVKTLTLVELSADEEMMATNRARGDQIRVAWELPKEALRAVNGTRCGTGDGTVDKIWVAMHPKARNFVMQAYNHLHNPQMAEVKDFLASIESKA